MKKTANAIDVHVGARVRQARMLLSMSQEKLGNALGLTFQQVQKYEKGTNRIGASRLVQISRTLRQSPGWFFEGVPAQADIEGPAPNDPMQELAVTSEGHRLARAFNAISDSASRAGIVRVCEAVAAATNQQFAQAAE